MNAVSFGNLLAGAGTTIPSDVRVSFWRRTYNVNDARAQVGRIMGDGSVSQGKVVIAMVIEAAKEWLAKLNNDARRDYAMALARHNDAHVPGATPPERPRIIRWNVLNTLQAVLSWTNFSTGECSPTYEMITERADGRRDTVNRHINILRELKLLDWVRRCEATGNKRQPTKAAPNSYFFEISRVPLALRILIQQKLKRRGVKLASHPERDGSGPVPNRAQRLASRVGKALSGAAEALRRRADRNERIAEAAFVRAEMQQMGDIPTDQWAKIRHPDDATAQAAYNERLGIVSFGSESLKTSLHSSPIEPVEKDRGRLGDLRR